MSLCHKFYLETTKLSMLNLSKVLLIMTILGNTHKFLKKCLNDDGENIHYLKNNNNNNMA